MKGLGKFLFGGFLGALLGFLISPRRGQRVRDALLGRDQPVVSQPQPLPAPLPSATATSAASGPPIAPSAEPSEAPSAEPLEPVFSQPVSLDVPAPIPVFEVEVEHPAATGAESVPTSEIEVAETEPAAETESAEPPSPAEPAVETQTEAETEIAVEPAVEPETAVEAEPAEELEVQPETALQPAQAVESELAVEPAPEPEQASLPTWAEPPAVTFEEPAVTGWATPEVEPAPVAATVEEAPATSGLGVGWDVPEPAGPIEDEGRAVEEVAGPGPESVADLKSRIEETRRRIQRELDHPFGGEGAAEDEWAGAQSAVSFAPPSEIAAEGVGPASAELASVVKEGMFEPTAPQPLEEGGSFEEESSSAPQMTPWGAYEPLESDALSEVGGSPTEKGGLEVPAMSEAASALAEPMTPWGVTVPLAEQTVPQVEQTASSAGQGVSEHAEAEPFVAEVPVVETPVAQAPVTEQPVPTPEAAGFEAPGSIEPLTEEVDRLIHDEVTREVPTPPTESEAAPGEFDHEAMRRRIEETRNRLKAKAFDAMMSGETALLGRDAEDAKRAATQTHVQVDTEVAETIESTLTEEDL